MTKVKIIIQKYHWITAPSTTIFYFLFSFCFVYPFHFSLFFLSDIDFSSILDFLFKKKQIINDLKLKMFIFSVKEVRMLPLNHFHHNGYFIYTSWMLLSLCYIIILLLFTSLVDPQGKDNDSSQSKVNTSYLFWLFERILKVWDELLVSFTDSWRYLLDKAVWPTVIED